MRTKGRMVVCYTGVGKERVLELGTKVNYGCRVEECVENVVCTVKLFKDMCQLNGDAARMSCRQCTEYGSCSRDILSANAF